MSDKPLHWWQWLIPTYGNWGGPGYSGGVYTDNPTEVNWDVEPIDEMDRAFMLHDAGIQSGFGGFAHRLLAINLEKMEPPKTLYGKAYRLVAIVVFRVLGKYTDED